jgi:hypothetical protein
MEIFLGVFMCYWFLFLLSLIAFSCGYADEPCGASRQIENFCADRLEGMKQTFDIYGNCFESLWKNGEKVVGEFCEDSN